MNQIPVGVYTFKIKTAESKASKKGPPMFVVDSIILSKDGSDVVDGTEGQPITIGGRNVSTMYISLSPKAIPMSKDRLTQMGVSEEALAELDYTQPDEEWAVQYLRDRCFQAVLVPDITYVCDDGRARTESDLKRHNEDNKASVKFLLNGSKPIVRGARLEITDIIGACTEDGQPL